MSLALAFFFPPKFAETGNQDIITGFPGRLDLFGQTFRNLHGLAHGVIQIWDLISGEAHRRIPASVSMAEIILEALAPGGDLFLWVDPKSQAHLWDLAEGREVDLFSGINGASFSPDGRYFWLDTQVHGSFLHDLTGKAKPISVTNPGSKFTSVAFEPDGRFLIVGSMDKKIAVWDLPKRQKVFSAPFKMPSAISASKGGGSF